jgi:hypothetical protein
MRVSVHIRIVLTLVLMTAIVVGASSQQPCPVDLPCNGIPRFAEYGNIRGRDERAVIDHLAKALRLSSDHIVFVMVYAGQEACIDEARQRALRIKSYLIKKYGIAAARIVLKDGEPPTAIMPIKTIKPRRVPSNESCKEVYFEDGCCEKETHAGEARKKGKQP